MNENHSENLEEVDESPVKIWLEDNLRVLLSVIIVIAIAGGIYSYSKRSQAPTINDSSDQVTQEDSLLDNLATSEPTATDMAQATKEVKKDSAASNSVKAPQVTSTSNETSKETETSFIESAQKGDGATHLARRALANYLEKNPDSSLTIEHKIYIEDYLRKNVPHDRLTIGSSIEFSKDLIQGAIEQSKQLNDQQLQHLKIYSARAPSLR